MKNLGIKIAFLALGFCAVSGTGYASIRNNPLSNADQEKKRTEDIARETLLARDAESGSRVTDEEKVPAGRVKDFAKIFEGGAGADQTQTTTKPQTTTTPQTTEQQKMGDVFTKLDATL